MSENNQNSTNSSKNSKQRLGRGLGSLLGGIPNQGAEFTDSTPQVKATIISRPSQAAVPVARVENDSDSSVEATRKAELKTTEISIEKVTATTVHVENSAVSNPSSAQVPSFENSIAPSAASVALPAAVLTIPDNARIWTIPVEKLVANSQQPRQVFEDSALKELAASIR
jgi:hypothetical protein